MAAGKGAVVVDKRAIGDLSRAVKRKKLTREQHGQLRVLIAQLEKIEAEQDGLGRTVRYNLQVIDTQIRDVLARSDGAAFDENAVAAMPEQMQKRILERLENVAERLSRDTTQARMKTYSTQSFKCVADFEICRAKADGARYWCTIALLVCLAGKLGESFIGGKGSK